MCYNLHRAAAALLCVVALAGCTLAPQRSRPLNVVATIVPLADWARQVGGARVQEQLIVPPGVDPRSYTPTEAQRRAINAADVVLLNGLDLEPWLDSILDQVRNNRIVVLDVSQFTGPLVEEETLSGARAFEQGAAENRPRLGPNQEQGVAAAVPSAYLWLDPSSAMRQVGLVAQTLTRADPDGISAYRQNAARYNGELENLDGRIQRRIDTWKWPSLVANDTALHPFARRYGLPLNKPVPSSGKRAVDLNQPLLVDTLRDSPSAPTRGGERQRRIVSFNPLAGQTYIELMQNNALTMTTAMAEQDQARGE